MKLKRVLSIVLTILIAISALPLTSTTVSAESYSGNCGTGVTWSLDTDTGVLTISGTGDMWDYRNSSSAPWYSYSSYVKKIIISEGVTSIGNYAFYNFSKLTSIEIPEGVTSIGYNTFDGCSSLTSIEIPDGVTSIGDEAFSGCSSLISIEIPDSVTSIGYNTFDGCSSLTSIKIPDGITSISAGTFSGCSSLTSIEIPEGVTSIGNSAFYYCRSLTSIEIPEGVTSIGNHAFSGCSSLTSIKIPDGVTSIGSDAFSDCSSLISIEIPDGVASIGSSAFTGCSSLTSIEIPDGVTSIGEWAFMGCRSLTSIEIPDGVTSIGGSAFLYCENLKTVYNFSSLTIIKGSTSNGYVGYYAENIYTPCTDGAHTGGSATCTEVAFCTLCNRPYGEVDTTNHINTELRGDFEATCVSDGYSGDYYCLDCGELAAQGQVVNALGHDMVEGECTRCGYTNATDKGTCGESAKWLLYLDGSLVIYGSGEMETYSSYEEVPWHRYVDSITSISVEGSVKSISPYAFYGLSKVEKVSLSYNITEIPAYSFYGCSALSTFVLSNRIKKIGDYAFYGCVGLSRVEIGANINTVGSNAFSNCTRVTAIYFNGKAPETVGTTPFGDTSSTTVYYYVSGSGWKNAVENDRWNGYQAIPRNAVTESISGTEKIYIVKVIDKYNIPVTNAAVNLNGNTQHTDSKGMAYFTKPTGAVSLTVSKTGFTDFSDSSFESNAIGVIEYIGLSDEPTVLTGVKCNGTTISNTVVTVNCFNSGTMSVTVSGSCPRGIVGYKILQDERLLQEVRTTSKTHEFNIDHSLLDEGGKIIVQMETAEGDIISKQLNIDIIKMTTEIDDSFMDTLSNINIKIPGVCTIPFHLEAKKDNGIAVKEEGRLLYVGINMDIGKLAEAENDKEKKTLVEKAKKKARTEVSGEAGCNFEYVGYVIIYYIGNGEFEVLGSDLEFVFSVGMSTKVSKSFLGIIGINFEVSLKGTASLHLVITDYNLEELVLANPKLSADGLPQSEVDLSFALELNVALSPYILWGAGKASGYGKLTAEITLEIYPDFGIEKIYVGGEIGYKYRVCWWFKGEGVICKGKLYEYDRDSLSAQSTYPALLRSMSHSSEYSSINDRAYLNDRSEWLYGSTGFSLADTCGSLQNSVYDGIEPKLVTLNGTTLMLWIDDNAARSEDNYQTLYYSVYNNETGIWSEPMQVDSNGTFDCEFNVYSDGNDIYVIYTEQTSELTGVSEIDISSEEDMEKIFNGVEVKVCKFDGTSFSEPVALTNNTVCEVMPVITSQNGVITAAWTTRTVDGKNNAVYISELENGIWSEPQALVAGQNEILSFDYGKLGSEYVAVYTVDTDGDYNTSDDIALMIVDRDGNTKRVDYGFIADIRLDEVNSIGSLFWQKDSNIYYMNGNTQTVYTVFDGDYTDCSNFKVVTLADGRTLLTFVSGTRAIDENGKLVDTGSDVFGVFVTENGVEGSGFKLTDTNGYIDSYDVEVVDGKLMIPFLLTQASVDGEDLVTTADFKVAFAQLTPNLTLNEVDFIDAKVQAGDTFTVNATVTNNGATDISSVITTITDSSGNVVFEGETAVSLKPGESSEIEISVTAPAEISEEAYTLSVIADGVTDKDETDNSTEIKLGVADLSVVAQQTVIGSNNYVSIVVTNCGNIATDGTVTVTNEDGDVIAELDAGTFAVGETKQFLADIGTISADGTVTCSVESSKEDGYKTNNSTMVYVVVVNQDTVWLSATSPVTESPELSETSIAYDKFTDNGISVEIEAGIDNFTGITGLVEGTDYTVTNNRVSITSQYLDSLPTGLNKLEFTFDYDGTGTVSRTLTLSVGDTTSVSLTGSVAISGTLAVGNTVIADVSGIDNTSATVSYEWFVDGVSVGTQATYEIKSDDAGKTIKLIVSGTEKYTGQLSYSGTVADGKTTGITLSDNSMDIHVGDMYSLIATVIPSDAKVVWSSDNTSVATVNAGTVFAKGIGTAQIKAEITVEGVTYSAACEVTVYCLHENTTVVEYKASTCNVHGNEEYTACDDCGEILSDTDTKLPLAEHTQVQIPAVAPTCTVAGKTEGSHCSVCGEVIVPQETVPAKGHNAVTDEAFAPTCTVAGKTEGSHCSVCGEVIVPQETVPAKGHNAVTDEAIASTCTVAGKTEGSHCSVCGEVIVAQKIIYATGHSAVTDEAIAPTFTKPGLTGGSHCVICGEDIIPQEVLRPLGYTIYMDTDKVLAGYDDTLIFEAEGELVSYQWYATDNKDLSKSVAVRGATTYDFSPMDFYGVTGQQGKYKYFYCVAKVYDGGLYYTVTSPVCTNAMAFINETDYSYIDYENAVIHADSTDNVGSYENIFTLEDADGLNVTVNASYEYSDVKSYGTGSTVTLKGSGAGKTIFEIVVYGDVNGDGVVDVLDSAQIASASSNKTTLDGIYNTAADINGDGVIDVLDYSAAVNKAVM